MTYYRLRFGHHSRSSRYGRVIPVRWRLIQHPKDGCAFLQNRPESEQWNYSALPDDETHLSPSSPRCQRPCARSADAFIVGYCGGLRLTQCESTFLERLTRLFKSIACNGAAVKSVNASAMTWRREFLHGTVIQNGLTTFSRG